MRERVTKDYIILIKDGSKIKLKIYNEKVKVRVVILSRRQLVNLVCDGTQIISVLTR